MAIKKYLRALPGGACAIVVVGFAMWYTAMRDSGTTTLKSHRLAETTAMQAPHCGSPDDKRIQVPPDWTTFTPPAVGSSYMDQVFGCRVERLTDSSHEETLPNGTHPSFNDYYSTSTPINSTDTMVLIGSNTGAWRIKDLTGKIVIAADKMPRMNNGHPVWDASAGSIFYYTYENALYKGTINRNLVKSTSIFTFKEYRGIVSPDAADLSQDGNHIALVGQNPNGTMDVFVWSLAKQTKESVYTTECKVNQWGVTQTPQPGCVHKLLLTPENLLAIDFADDGIHKEQGVRLWNGSKLMHLQDGTNHMDTGYDLEGNPVFIEVGRPSTLSGEANPCPGRWGLDVRRLEDLSSAVCLLDKQPSWHVSYRGGPSQPWAAISFFDERKTGPELFNNNPGFQEPSQTDWHLYEDEIILARIDGGAIFRLAHARSRSAEGYEHQPRAAISRDGKYVAFTSSMAYPDGCPAHMHVPGECTDVYVIQVR
jgi:hypothetical protein